MQEDLRQLQARLLAHELVIELVVANMLCDFSESEASDFLSGLKQNMSYGHASPYVDPDALRQHGSDLMDQSAEMVIRICEKVEVRAKQMRAMRSAGA